MSTSRDSCCLPSVKKQKHDFQVFAFVQCIIKQLLDSVFVISRIIKVSVRVISLSLRLRLITLTSTLIILDITKTSSNNCLLSACRFAEFDTSVICHVFMHCLSSFLMQDMSPRICFRGTKYEIYRQHAAYLRASYIVTPGLPFD